MWKVVLFCLVASLLASASVHANQSTFTYQGSLQDQGNPANGSYDLEFRLYGSAGNDDQVGSSQVVENVPVASGVFTVALDFGLPPFSGSDLFLEIWVRPGASAGAFTRLVPRQVLTAAPYAINATKLNGLPASDYALANHPNLANPLIVNGAPAETSAIVTGRNYANFGVGVFGDAHGDQSYGVWGVAQANGYGVQGESPTGVGVRGNSDSGIAILGYTQSGETGIWGSTGLLSGFTYGVLGSSQSSTGRGVKGHATAASGTATGVEGESNSSDGRGVLGVVTH